MYSDLIALLVAQLQRLEAQLRSAERAKRMAEREAAERKAELEAFQKTARATIAGLQEEVRQLHEARAAQQRRAEQAEAQRDELQSANVILKSRIEAREAEVAQRLADARTLARKHRVEPDELAPLLQRLAGELEAIQFGDARRAELAAEGRLFFADPLDPRQHGPNASLRFEPEFYQDWQDGDQRFAVRLFGRLDSGDDERTHADVR